MSGFTDDAITDMNTTTDLISPLISWGKDVRGYYVEFEEGVWENAEFIDWVNGFPIYTKRLV